MFKNDEKSKIWKTFSKSSKTKKQKDKKGSVVLEGSNYIKKGEVENWKTW